jgi:GxxExxY protein
MGKVQTPYDELTYKIIGLAMAVHNELGPGFSEEIYQRAMALGMTQESVLHEREFPIELTFRGQKIGKFELDFVANCQIILELKAVTTLAPVHEQQIIAYLAASGLPLGLLINFGATRLEYRRIFPPKAIQSSSAYKHRQSNSIFSSVQSVPSVDQETYG